MHTLRRSADRGHADFGWLDTRHSFSFGNYYDPRHMGFASLRVINEDFVRGGGGFAPHGHANMEIVTYVISGQLPHRDSLGNAGIIRPGEVQRMSAGRGIQHSEMNPSTSATVHLLQIWLTPEVHDTAPDYAHDLAQWTPAANAVKLPDSLVFVTNSSANQSSVAWNPQCRKYYSLRPGLTTYPLETWVATGGLSIFQTTTGLDMRGIWWNPNTLQLECNLFNAGG